MDFTKEKVGQLVANKHKLVAIPPTTSITNSLDIMATNNILSIPIYSHSKKDKLSAIVNVFDICTYVTSKYKNQKLKPEDLTASIETVMTLDPDDESYLVWEVDYNDELKSVKENSKNNLKPKQRKQTLIKFTNGVHRALVTDITNQKPPIIITQSDVVRYIDKNSKAEGKLNEPLTSLGFVGTPVVSMKVSETAIEGYQRMNVQRILAVPVLDVNGSIVANLSVSDLRGITAEKLECLKLPVLDFLKSMKERHALGAKPTGPAPGALPLVVKPTTTLKEAMDILVEKHVHRVWIVEDSKVKGVVSLSDVIRKVTGV